MFPFAYPFATQFYLDLYVVTLVAHLLAMFYVFAGTCHLALFGGMATTSAAGRINDIVRDWLPFALSVAITAGIAPLLFIQLLYQFDYYTANVLLSHRWMSILPVLIVAFYGLYLLKMKIFQKSRRLLDRLIAIFVFGCVCYVGYTFSENHLLSIQSKLSWAEHYASHNIIYWTWEILPRVGVILGQAFSATSVVLYWQIAMTMRQRREELPQGVQRHLAVLSMLGLLISMVSLAVYAFGVSQGQFVGSDVHDASLLLRQPYIYAFVIGLLAQAWLWSTVWLQGERLAQWGLPMAIVSALTLLMGAMLREQYRAQRIVTDDLLALHQSHLASSGVWLFFVFAAVNTTILVWLIGRTRAALEEGQNPSPAITPQKSTAKPIRP